MPLFLLAFAMLLGAGSKELLRIEALSSPGQVKVIAAIPKDQAPKIPKGKLTQDQGEQWLQLVLLDDQGQEGSPIFGRYERQGDDLILAPRNALTAKQRYRAKALWSENGPLLAEYRVPAPAETPPPVVDKIYPTSSVLPANQLKFYLHFSRPMRETKAIFEQIMLLDQDGKEITDPWRNTQLWSADSRRLTLWIHPGRVKKGVNLREEFGPPLQPGKNFTLVLSTKLVDADGKPLAKAFTKTFKTAAEDRGLIRVRDWKIAAPPAGSKEPVVVTFPKPLDGALLDRFLTVVSPDGTVVKGRIEVADEEKSWSFHPAVPWTAGEFKVKVDELLEDLAGNTPVQAFDADLDDIADATPKLTLTFKPRSASTGGERLPLVTDLDRETCQRQCAALAVRLATLKGAVAADTLESLERLAKDKSPDRNVMEEMQRLLDPLCLIAVTINPESRVKAARGPRPADLPAGRDVFMLVKVNNQAGVTHDLKIAGHQLRAEKKGQGWLEAEVYASDSKGAKLSGEKLEYLLIRFKAHETGKREATLKFDVGQGTQDLGFRAEVPVLFAVGGRKR